ncbi:helix-turn-helix transcriptional regulator [Microbacterium sp. CR_7]|uniref:helix-turn-helix transcriptional regulator n=1 Tax=Microbacterium sp. CR_7 TaxID=3055792 RepID=UPI0035C0A311
MSGTLPIRMAFATRDPEEATAAVQAALGGGAFTGVRDEMDFVQTAAAFEGLVDGRMFVNAKADAYLADGYSTPFLMILRSGTMQVRQGGAHHETITLRPGDAMLMAPEITTFAELESPDIDFIQFGGDELDDAALDAFPEASSLRFQTPTPRSGDASRLLVQTAHNVRSILASDDLSARPLLLRSALRTLAVVTLDAFDVATQMTDRHRGAGTVRRALLYIDDHIATPMTVHDIAAAAGVSVRTLQDAFRRVRNETPVEYVQRARLDVVRRALQRADPVSGAVSDIARRWGFSSMGRFAVAYRQQFGERPSDTLAR